jgi:hypothetical protein
VERGNVQDNAIIEVGFQMQVRSPTQFVLEVLQFREELFLPFHLLGEPFGFLTRIARYGLLTAKSFETTGFQADLRFDVVHEGLEEKVFVESVVVEPKSVALLRGLKEPVDRGITATLGVAGDMTVPKTALSRLPKVIPQFLHAKYLAGILLDGIGLILPNDIKNVPHTPNDVINMIGIIFAARKQSNHRIFVEVVSPFDNITLILLRSS